MTESELEKAIRAKRAEYARNWRKKNPEKEKAINRRYWKKKILKEMEASNAGTTESNS